MCVHVREVYICAHVYIWGSVHMYGICAYAYALHGVYVTCACEYVGCVYVHVCEYIRV